MKNLKFFHYSLFFLSILFCSFHNIKAQKILTKKMEKKISDTPSMKRPHFYGTWTVKNIKGDIYDIVGDQKVKIKYGLQNWKNYQFTFKSDSLSIRFRNKLIRKSAFAITEGGNALTLKRNIGLVYQLPIAVNQNKLEITFSPEAYLKTLADELTKVEDLQKRYYIPENIVFYLER